MKLGERLAGLLEEVGAVGAEGVGGEGLKFRDESFVGRALGGELGGALGVKGGKLLEFVAEAGDFGGEAKGFFVEGAGSLDESRGAAVPENPSKNGAEESGEKGGDGKGHVRIR